MKFYFTLLFGLFSIINGESQVLYSQNFEDGMGDMILINADNRTPAPQLSDFVDAWTAYEFFENNFSAVSISWYAPPGKSDDWMITPIVSGITEKTVLNWKAMAVDEAYPDGYEVLISENGSPEIADFKKLLVRVNRENPELTDRSLSLADFAGKDIRIAFRNISNDMFLLLVDDIEVVILKDFDMKVSLFAVDKYSPINTAAEVRYEITNNGSETVTDFTFEWTDGENVYTENVGGQTLKYGQGYSNLLSMTPTEAKNYELAIEVTQVNGNSDQYIDDNFGVSSLTAVSKTIPRKMIAEEATGTWCVWCPRGSVFMEKMKHDFPNDFIGIAVHNEDPMMIADYDTPFGDYISGFPSVVINRDIDIDPADMPDYFSGIVSRQYAPIEVNANHKIENGIITVSGDVTFYTQLDDAKFNVVGIILEDNVKGTTSAYNQGNAYAGGSNGVMGGYEILPDPVPASQMVYQEVARALPLGFLGSGNIIPEVVNVGSVFPFNFNYTLPTNQKKENIYAAVFVTNEEGVAVGGESTDALYTNVDQVEVVEKLAIFPNPTNDITFVQLNLKEEVQLKISVFNTLGQMTASKDYGRMYGEHIFPVKMETLCEGIYYIHIQLNDDVITRKVMVK
ncbi:MAG: choice-of-anchor J domain-containing protein [Saprospiraceae bacterium]